MTDRSGKDIGNYGEQLASNYLEGQGYVILERNYRYKRAEIDIICQKDQLLVFVEVKTKSYTAFGEPEASVDERKASKVMEGAEQFMIEYNWHNDIRFDVIAISLQNNEKQSLRHFQDAFH